jgi:spermidine/putrescine-binding protein
MFCENKKPDWDTIFEEEDKIFSVIILDNNSRIIPSDILRFNYSDLAKDFEKTDIIRN